MMEWQPIKTAPKDKFVVIYEDGLIWMAGYSSDDDKWYCDHPDFDGAPTLWMLPDPPKETV